MAMRLRLLQQALRQLRRSTGQTEALAKYSGEASPMAAATCAPPQSKVDTAILQYDLVHTCVYALPGLQLKEQTVYC